MWLMVFFAKYFLYFLAHLNKYFMYLNKYVYVFRVYINARTYCVRAAYDKGPTVLPGGGFRYTLFLVLLYSVTVVI